MPDLKFLNCYTSGALKYGNLLVGFAEYKCPFCEALTNFTEHYVNFRCFILESRRIPYLCPSCKNIMILDTRSHKLIKNPRIEPESEIIIMMKRVNMYIENLTNYSSVSKEEMRYKIEEIKRAQ